MENVKSGSLRRYVLPKQKKSKFQLAPSSVKKEGEQSFSARFERVLAAWCRTGDTQHEKAALNTLSLARTRKQNLEV